jgi:ketosteroid isomerase-like protein
MAHPNEQLLRDAYTAFARGDLDGYWAACADDFTFNVPGSSKVAGSFRGKEAFMGMIGNVMALTGGRFEEEVHDVLATDHHGVVLAIHRFPRNGQTHEYRTAHVYEIRDGRLIECWEQPQDPTAFDTAWA